ncbi:MULTISPECIES: phage portal protein [Actinosynnema]|uniref:Phage portal protein n=1 Tax=Actinosynnema pretiosum TaxID=42197 RepID=A0A290ZB07_9PSEU|nr:phage portal protein [Actinosynnema pretiosum]ATE56153.1 hypothetical protein CNX65_25125 [Actinosynnema pretiosum]MCP2098603.1 Phage portal protein, SPP1 Gp6-like [Actinosynnema pretiosum]
MDPRTAAECRELGLYELRQRRPDLDRWKGYATGTGQDRPYAPDGVSNEYLRLREMSMAPWLDLVEKAAVQRQAVDGFRTNADGRPDEEADAATWEIWRTNQLHGRQSMVYSDRMVYGQGIVSVWPQQGALPLITPESPRRVFLFPHDDNPFRIGWAVKNWTTKTPSRTTGQPQWTDVEHAVVYDETSWIRYRRTAMAGGAGWLGGGWTLVASGTHPHGIPFVAFPNDQDSEGRCYSEIERLIPLQDSINTTRFNLMLAMQFAAFRQRGVIGFDPLMRDAEGRPIPQVDAEGRPIIDPHTGQPKPLMSPVPRAGVDRTWVFPGADTKIFEFSESDLRAYADAMSSHVQHLSATSQTPPHYLLGQLSNLSAEALTAAETTLTRKVAAACTTDAAAWEEVMGKAALLAGSGTKPFATQAMWRKTESVSIGQVVDAITKLVGGPVLAPESGREMIPGATPQDQERWRSQFTQHQAAAAARLAGGDLASVLTMPKFQQPGEPVAA